jgi:hypothetical protein
MGKVKWVNEIPPPSAGQQSQWKNVVDELLSKPGKPALVYQANSSTAANSARNVLVSHIKSRAAQVDVYVRGNDLYAICREGK